jgi:hypothetical protein
LLGICLNQPALHVIVEFAEAAGDFASSLQIERSGQFLKNIPRFVYLAGAFADLFGR